MALDLRSSELEYSFIKERISSVEKHLYDISVELSNYNKNLARVRDSGDEFAKSVSRLVSNENLNQSLKTSLCEFSNIFSALQSYRDIQIQRINSKTVTEFSNYNSVCKQANEHLNRCRDARNTEFKKQTQLEKMRGKHPTDYPKISQAEREAIIARDEATRIACEMSRRIDSFEKNKLEDIKNSLLKFSKIEMMFHAKAIELHTNAYNIIKNINVEEDLKEFRYYFRAKTSTLDNQCLSNTENVSKNIDGHGDGMHIQQNLTPDTNTHGSQKTIFTLKSDYFKMDNSNSSLKTISDTKLDFGDQSL